MRIDGRRTEKTDRPAEARGENAKRPLRREGDAARTGGDQVTLGHANVVQRALEGGSAERARRIEQLQAVVNTGSYRVDALEVSRAIVAEALQSSQDGSEV